MSERERWSPLCLSHSFQAKKALAPLNLLLPLSLSCALSLSGFPVKQRQLQCLRLKGPWLKLKPDSSCLSVDHGHLIWPSLQTSQLQIQINTPAKSSCPLLLLGQCISLTSPDLFRALWPRPKEGNASGLQHPVPKFLCLDKCLLLSLF